MPEKSQMPVNNQVDDSEETDVSKTSFYVMVVKS